ncbi:MAG: hypothetical protein M1405_01865 [Patescibacteria group bacterium]|nr:hypothetical protein [Patescibacteria group bacterium]
MFLQIVLILIVISIILSLWSLRGANSRPDTDKLRKKLNKNRVIFQSHSSSTSGS